MKNLIILTTIILALLTLTGCGGGNQAQQAAPNQADNGGQQVQGNQQAEHACAHRDATDQLI